MLCVVLHLAHQTLSVWEGGLSGLYPIHLQTILELVDKNTVVPHIEQVFKKLPYLGRGDVGTVIVGLHYVQKDSVRVSVNRRHVLGVLRQKRFK